MDLSRAAAFTFFCIVIFHLKVHGAYDYSYTLECVPLPRAPLYAGGILENPEFNEGLSGWKADGNATIQLATSADGNNFAIASNIGLASNTSLFSDGLSQTIFVEKGKLYTISAWIQVAGLQGEGEVRVQGNAKTSTSGISVNWIFAKTGCWKMLKGGFVANATESLLLQFQAFNASDASLEIWVDSISLQPFTQDEWDAQNDLSFEKVRKGKLKLEVLDLNGNPVANASVAITQLKPNFPFGGLLNKLILDNSLYQKWFLERYTTHAVFENELKWGFDEPLQGVENYTIPDAMLQFAKDNGLIIRGHNIVWDDAKFLLPWMKALSPDQLREAVLTRIKSVVARYKGQFIHWDVVNENMHYDSISKLFPGKSTDVFKLTHEIDPAPLLFLNEFNVVEANYAGAKAGPPVFLAKIDELRSGGYDGPLGIGLQCHFGLGEFGYWQPNLPSIRASLDMFAATGLPVWATEFTVGDHLTNQVQLVMPLLRELHSHPTVQGIFMWTTLDENAKCFEMCLTDNNYKNIPVGDVVDDFKRRYIRSADSNGTTDSNGIFEASLVYGEYEATITQAQAHYSESLWFDLVPTGNVTTLAIKVNM